MNIILNRIINKGDPPWVSVDQEQRGIYTSIRSLTRPSLCKKPWWWWASGAVSSKSFSHKVTALQLHPHQPGAGSWAGNELGRRREGAGKEPGTLHQAELTQRRGEHVTLNMANNLSSGLKTYITPSNQKQTSECVCVCVNVISK